jgi:hypothetical protein
MPSRKSLVAAQSGIEQRRRLADDLLSRVAEALAGLAVGVDDVAALFLDEQCIGRVVDHGAEPRNLLAQLSLRTPAPVPSHRSAVQRTIPVGVAGSGKYCAPRPGARERSRDADRRQDTPRSRRKGRNGDRVATIR